MKEVLKQIRYFFFSQYFADGFRITIEIIAPVIVLSWFGETSAGLTVALGSLCVSICDIPGPVKEKRNGMLYCNLLVFVMTILTGFASGNNVFLGLLVVSAAFIFSMFNVYGNRAAAVGTSALLVMILRMADIRQTSQIFSDSFLILAGGVWYMLAALLFVRLNPYRHVQRALGDCIQATAKLLGIKSELYNSDANYENEYSKLLMQQAVVNERQEVMRQLLFGDKSIGKDADKMSGLLVLTFVDVLDLYEQITATWYNYSLLRKRFGHTSILKEISHIIKELAGELENIGLAIQSGSKHQKKFPLIPALNELNNKIDTLKESDDSKIVLKKIIVNLRNLGNYIDELFNYFSMNIPGKKQLRNRSDYAKFLPTQQIDFITFKNNLNMSSGIFRHALRMMITCGVGFFIARLISSAHHSYWILLTIIIILKPGFSISRQRNVHRIIGTIAGAFIGLIILRFVHEHNFLFSIIIFLMLGTYSFQRLNYIVMVIFTTAYVIVLFNFLGLGLFDVAWERLMDTGIASLLAFASSYFLFPHWESLQMDSYIVKNA